MVVALSYIIFSNVALNFISVKHACFRVYFSNSPLWQLLKCSKNLNGFELKFNFKLREIRGLTWYHLLKFQVN